MVTTQRYRAFWDEAMCSLLGRLAFPTRLHTMTQTFGCLRAALCAILVQCNWKKKNDIFFVGEDAAALRRLHANQELHHPPLKPDVVDFNSLMRTLQAEVNASLEMMELCNVMEALNVKDNDEDGLTLDVMEILQL
ncbi:hypothetical protein DYB35_012355 [Aphanomyces astaci]|uniref:Uncharacterized protein n=1 Tax=Aphanomyces astaci TaxID=112090 RepID=A0A3R7AQQ9_APHAT|nr:hypothetical protein DYB35_012355 [Aphanomyces astaci]